MAKDTLEGCSISLHIARYSAQDLGQRINLFFGTMSMRRKYYHQSIRLAHIHQIQNPSTILVTKHRNTPDFSVVQKIQPAYVYTETISFGFYVH